MACRRCFWSVLELSLCVIGTSITTLKPLVSKLGFFKDPSTTGHEPEEGEVRNNNSPSRSTMRRKALRWLNGDVSAADTEAAGAEVGRGTAKDTAVFGQLPKDVDGSKEKSVDAIGVLGEYEGSD